MWVVKCLDLRTDKTFEKEFWNYKKVMNFINKCKYSDKIKVLMVEDRSKFYD